MQRNSPLQPRNIWSKLHLPLRLIKLHKRAHIAQVNQSYEDYGWGIAKGAVTLHDYPSHDCCTIGMLLKIVSKPPNRRYSRATLATSCNVPVPLVPLSRPLHDFPQVDSLSHDCVESFGHVENSHDGLPRFCSCSGHATLSDRVLYVLRASWEPLESLLRASCDSSKMPGMCKWFITLKCIEGIGNAWLYLRGAISAHTPPMIIISISYCATRGAHESWHAYMFWNTPEELGSVLKDFYTVQS